MTQDRREYYRRYREANRERLRQYDKKWREKHSGEEDRAKRNDYAREWRRKNPDKVKAAQARYWAKRLESSESVG